MFYSVWNQFLLVFIYSVFMAYPQGAWGERRTQYLMVQGLRFCEMSKQHQGGEGGGEVRKIDAFHVSVSRRLWLNGFGSSFRSV